MGTGWYHGGIGYQLQKDQVGARRHYPGFRKKFNTVISRGGIGVLTSRKVTNLTGKDPTTQAETKKKGGCKRQNTNMCGGESVKKTGASGTQ